MIIKSWWGWVFKTAPSDGYSQPHALAGSASSEVCVIWGKSLTSSEPEFMGKHRLEVRIREYEMSPVTRLGCEGHSTTSGRPTGKEAEKSCSCVILAS